MARGEIHALLAVDRRLQQLGQFHQQRHALGRARHALRDDLRALGIDQQLRGFAERRPCRPTAAWSE